MNDEEKEIRELLMLIGAMLFLPASFYAAVYFDGGRFLLVAPLIWLIVVVVVVHKAKRATKKPSAISH